MCGACSTHGKHAYRILVGKPGGKTSLGRLRLRGETVIKTCLRHRMGECGLDSPESG
jgi:hypothetical protein